MAGPLSHIRVLDLSRVLAGPWAGQTLADLGADVIKVERPGRGDDTRGWGPPYLTDAEGRETVESAYFLSTNRGKRSITLDLANPSGQRIARDLAAHCDILIENYKVGGLAKYGLAYDDLKDSHGHLIYCSITGFGQSGPYAGRAGYDFMIQGMGGLMSITGEPDEVPGGGPVKVGVAISDLFTGMYAVTAVLAALAHRERGGGGQHIDMALLDCQVAMLANQGMNYLTSGKSPGRLGNAHPNIVPYQAFQTADSHIIIAVGNDAQFARFCEAIGRPDLAAEPAYADNGGRVKNREALVSAIAGTLAELNSQPLQAALDAVGIPWGPINTIEQLFADPQVVARGLRFDLDHPLAGSVPMVRNPIRYSKTEIDHDAPPPLLGEHTDAVLAELLSLNNDELENLRATGVIS
ncbi:MAG: CaiB/BaiF CoA-transferase family protein [Alphaproteobacteria bacterium]|nr:CaiB/BaiF CoA-transferase family protein [Alphaproteobacteria bacterium]